MAAALAGAAAIATAAVAAASAAGRNAKPAGNLTRNVSAVRMDAAAYSGNGHTNRPCNAHDLRLATPGIRERLRHQHEVRGPGQRHVIV